MKNIRIPAAVILAAVAIFQASVGDALSFYGVKPSLIFITIYALSIRAGEGKGLLYGAAGGIIEDCLSGGLLGLMLSGNAVAGYLAGRMGKRVYNVGEVANFMGIFLLSLTQGVYVSAAIVTLISSGDLLVAVVRNALPQAFMNAAVGTFLLWLIDTDAPVMRFLARLAGHVQVHPRV